MELENRGVANVTSARGVCLSFRDRVWNNPPHFQPLAAAMTPESVFAKSPKGFEEIDTRAHRLGPKLRQVLIRVDGIKTIDELVDEAGEMGEILLGQIEDLVKQGFLTDTTAAEEIPAEETAAPVSTAVERAVPAAVVEPRPAPPAPKPLPPAPSESVEYNSPVKFRLQDLLVEAMGFETGKVGMALKACRNRDDLARWVEMAVVPIEQAAGKSRAKAFHKNARKLVGG